MPQLVKAKSLLVAAILMLVHSSSCIAQQYTYLYIQGDKKTPFYVKVNGKMAERYGKNHCIIPKLTPGTYYLEILFELNKYRPILDTIQITGSTPRQFLLVRTDTTYQLMDLDTDAPAKK